MLKICFVHIKPIKDKEHLHFLGNILIRTRDVLGEKVEIHFFYNGTVTSSYLKEKQISLHMHKMGQYVVFRKLSVPFQVVFKLRKICLQEHIDLVFNLSEHYSFFLLGLGAKLANCKKICRVAGILPYSKAMGLMKKIKKRIGRFFERISLNSADHVLCVSKSLKASLVQRGNNPEKISVISQGVDTNFFKPRATAEVAARPQKLLFIGRIVKNKGVDQGIEAFRQVKGVFPDIHFLVCGHGPEQEGLYRKYHEVEGVEFRGFIPRRDLPALYSSSDILVLPSFSEALPNVVLEAMASRLPVIASKVGDIPLLLGEGRGELVRPGQVDELATAIRKMMQEDSYRLQCTQKAYEFVVQNHSYKAVRKETVRVIRSVLGDDQPGLQP